MKRWNLLNCRASQKRDTNRKQVNPAKMNINCIFVIIERRVGGEGGSVA
jgi:hypothetical protein